jgi:hypothetical protein
MTMADHAKLVARLIGASTASSGLSLVLWPRRALRMMGAAQTDPAPLLYRVIGMFMIVSGGLLADGGDVPLAVRWSLAQKVGATVGVSAGVIGGQYRRRALAVAAFDGGCGVLLARMLLRGRR